MLIEKIGNNQFKIFLNNGVVFQSYLDLIAIKLDNDEVYVSKKWEYRTTTIKHLKLFLNITSTKEIQKLLDDGVYHLVSGDELNSLALALQSTKGHSKA